MAKHVCKAANRALGLVIAKSKVFGGFNFETFSKLYGSMVWSVINYGASVWGTRQFTCINSIQLRATRYFMEVGRYTPNAAVQGDCGWMPTVVRQWSTVLNQWQRLKSMDINRINYKVFEWCERSGNQRCKNWNFQINSMLRDADISLDNTPNLGVIKDQVAVFLFSKFKTSWLADVNRQDARNGNVGNKLRTYRLFKQEFKSEPYLTCPMSKSHRSAYAKFRSGVAPIRIETGRYDRAVGLQ